MLISTTPLSYSALMSDSLMPFGTVVWRSTPLPVDGHPTRARDQSQADRRPLGTRRAPSVVLCLEVIDPAQLESRDPILGTVRRMRVVGAAGACTRVRPVDFASGIRHAI